MRATRTAAGTGNTQEEEVMSLPPFSMSFVTADEKRKSPSRRPHPVDRMCATTPAMARVLELLEDHRPSKMMDNIALLIVDQTYAALLEILGPAAQLPSGDDGHVEISRPVDPADPDSPLLCVNASATHCSIRLVDSLAGSEQGQPRYRDYLLARTSVSVAPGALHVSCRSNDDGPAKGWKCADDEVRPNVSEKGLFGVLEAIRARLDAAIRVEANLIKMAWASGCGRSAKLNGIMALDRMRRELDVDAIVRRRRQKRRRGIQEIGRCPDPDPELEAELLANRLGALRVGQKRCQPAPVMDIHVDDADFLTKRSRTLQV